MCFVLLLLGLRVADLQFKGLRPPPTPPDSPILRHARKVVFWNIYIGGFWGSGWFPLDWNRLGDSFAWSFSPNSGFWAQFDPISGICSWIRFHEHIQQLHLCIEVS